MAVIKVGRHEGDDSARIIMRSMLIRVQEGTARYDLCIVTIKIDNSIYLDALREV